MASGEDSRNSASSDEFMEALREAERMERQRLLRKQEHELHLARTRRGPDQEQHIQKVYARYAHLLKCHRDSFAAYHWLVRSHIRRQQADKDIC